MAVIHTEHPDTRTTLMCKSLPQAMICLYMVNLRDSEGVCICTHNPYPALSFVYVHYSLHVYLCMYFCVHVHAQTVRSKERKALCFLYTPRFLSVSKSATKESKHRDEGIKTLVHPHTPAHTCKYMRSLPGFSILFRTGWAELEQQSSNLPRAGDIIFSHHSTVPVR